MKSLFSINEAAEITGMCASTLRDWRKKEIIIPTYKGEKYLIKDLVLIVIAKELKENTFFPKEIYQIVRGIDERIINRNCSIQDISVVINDKGKWNVYENKEYQAIGSIYLSVKQIREKVDKKYF